MSLYRPERPPLRFVIPISQLPEFSDKALGDYREYNLKGFFGDVFGGLGSLLPDWAKKAAGFIEDVARKFSKIYDASRTLIKKILSAFAEFSGVIAEELLSKDNADAVAAWASNVKRSVEVNSTGTYAQRVFTAIQNTIDRPTRAQALAEAIVRLSK